MIKLDNITLICCDCFNYGQAVASLQKSMAQCEFARVIFFTDIKIDIPGIEVIRIPRITSKASYSRFIIKELWKYIETDYVLVTQHDGWVLNSDAWSDDFLEYDGIGSAWIYSDCRNNFNGGFCLMSKKLLTVVGTDNFIEIVSPDDEIIGRLYRNYLIEKHGIKFPTDEMCDRFAFELREPVGKTFGFHSFFHQEFKPTIIIKRSGALGDCVLIEPVMRWYYQNGYNVVLDMPPAIFELFSNHYFPVKHISQFNSERIIPAKEINLDMAYEIRPYQNYLKSYFEVCGIEDFELSKPILWPKVNNETKLFNRYVVLHVDERSQPERNVHGVKWKQVINWLEEKGLTVLQIGAGNNGGIKINTPSTAMLKFIIAGADLFLGVDSGPGHIAIAQGVPTLIMMGACDPQRIHPDLNGVLVQQNDCDKKGCWHKGTTAGVECAYNGTDKYLQCCTTDAHAIIDKLKQII